MASSREERLQMRQRGAGTRKVQEVDFGFSFGLPVATAAAPGAESTNSIDQVAQQQQQQQEELRHPEETTQTQGQTQTPSQDRNKVTPTQSPRSQPRSARVTKQTSRLEIGLEADQEQGRSSKRRRISSRDGDSNDSPVSQATATTHRRRTTDGERDANESRPDDTRVTVQGSNAEAHNDNPVTSNEDGNPPAPTEEPEASAKPKRGRRKSNVPKTTQSAREGDIEESPNTHEGRNNTATRSTRFRRQSNRTQQTQSSESTNRPDDHPIVNEPETAEKDEAQSEPRRRRKGPATQTTTTDDTRPEQSGSRSRSKRQRQQPARDTEAEVADTEEDNESVQPKRKRRKSTKSNAETGAEPQPGEEQEEAEPAQIQRRQGKQKASESDGQRVPAKKKRDQPQDQPESQPEPDQAAETAQVSKRRNGRPSAGNGPITRRTRPSGEDQGEQGREGTVSITVHRLADTSALEATAVDSDASTGEQGSEDELDTRQTFPHRAGVNAADVLAQICQEIVDKHLTGLANNVAHESNQAKRNEAGRQRKAVEAYGSQLQGRLFELSELLESNFALGVKLKKAKREATEMRNRLLEVRRQRHEVALRMDAVRQKHSAEENAKMSRNAVNNSLHKLESTLERSRARPGESGENDDDNDNGLAGLEFKLRTVAEDVSSRAEGSHGGLLSQVRAFNAQLETTAGALGL